MSKSKTNIGNFFEDFRIGQVLRHAAPRTVTSGEVALYTVNDRRRLEVKPGLTCIWQVSGRSNIPFEGQVKLDAVEP